MLKTVLQHYYALQHKEVTCATVDIATPRMKGSQDFPKYQIVNQDAMSSMKACRNMKAKKLNLDFKSPIFFTVARSS